jgi:DNA mismatch repair ATPase MutL
VCEHSPLSAADCAPAKMIRTTVKLYLRTEEKKRESARAKERKLELEREAEEGRGREDEQSRDNHALEGQASQSQDQDHQGRDQVPDAEASAQQTPDNEKSATPPASAVSEVARSMESLATSVPEGVNGDASGEGAATEACAREEVRSLVRWVVLFESR